MYICINICVCILKNKRPKREAAIFEIQRIAIPEAVIQAETQSALLKK